MANKEKNFISAVIYVHNMGGGGGKQIISFLSMVTEFFEANFEHSEIICVNDASTDNSVAIIKEFSKSVKLSSITISGISSK